MKFWEAMTDKYGFEDGSAYPDGVETYRDIYCKVVNKLAAKNGSQCRVVPFDRRGVHNYCMWMAVPVDWFEQVYLPQQSPHPKVAYDQVWKGVSFNELPDPYGKEPNDEQLQEAIVAAMDMDLDAFVEVVVKVRDDFHGFIHGM